jgi:hypothetical protein
MRAASSSLTAWSAPISQGQYGVVKLRLSSHQLEWAIQDELRRPFPEDGCTQIVVDDFAP